MAFKIEFQAQEAQAQVDALATKVKSISTHANNAGRALGNMGAAMRMKDSYSQKLKEVADSFDRIGAASSKIKSLGSPHNSDKTKAAVKAHDDLATSMQNVVTQLNAVNLKNKEGASALLQHVEEVKKAKKAAREAATAYGKWAEQLKKASKAYIEFLQAQNKAKTGRTLGSQRITNTNLIMLNSTVLKLTEAFSKLSGSQSKNSAQMTAEAVKAKALTKDMNALKKAIQGSEQASASMRATLNASGTHMGIYTGKTIVAATAFYSTTSAIKGFIQVGAEFTKEMIRANRIMGASAGESELLEAKVRDLAKTTVYTSGEVAEGLTYLAMAGLKPKEAFYALTPTLNLAKIGMISFAKAADIVTNVMRAFYIPAEEIGKVADVLSVAITNSNATIEQMAQALSYVAPVASAVGESIEDVTAMLTIFHDVGIKSSRAGTSLRRAYSNLLSPSEKAAKVLKRLNIITIDLNGNMLSMVTIMKDLARNGATAADMVSLFGVRAAPAMINLLRDLQQANPKLDEQVSLLEKAAGAAKDLGETLEQHLGADAKKMISALHEKFLELFEANEQGLRDMVQNTTDWIASLDTKKVQKFVDGLMNLADALRRNADLFLSLIKYIVGFTILRTLIGIVGTATTAFKHLTAGLMGLRGILLGISGAATLLTNTLGFLAVVTNKLAGPVGWILGAAALLIPLLYEWFGGQVDINKATKEGTSDLEKYNDELERRRRLTINGVEFGDHVMKTFNENGVGLRNVGDKKDPSISGKTTAQIKEWKEGTERLKESLRQHEEALSAMDTLNANTLDKQREAELLRQKSLTMQLTDWREIYQKKAEITKADIATEMEVNEVRKKVAEKEIARLQKEIAERNRLEAQASKRGLTPEGERRRQEIQKQLDEAFRAPDFKESSDLLVKMVKDAKANLDKLESLGIEQSDAAKNKITALADNALGKTQGDYNLRRNALLADMKKFEARGISVKGDYEGATPEHGGFTDSEIAEYKGLVEQLKELDVAYKDVTSTLKQFKDAALIENLKDIDKEVGFTKAAESAEKYNNKLLEQIEVEKQKIAVLTSGESTVESFKTATERLTIANADNTIKLQEEALIKLRLRDDIDPAILKGYEAKNAALITNTALMKKNIDMLAAYRKQSAELAEAEARRKELERGGFLTGQSKLDFDYTKDTQDLEDYYLMQKEKQDESLMSYAEYIQAKSEIDQEYWAASHEYIVSFHEELSKSLGDGISQMVVYGESWKSVGAEIRASLLTNIIQSLTEIMVKKAQEHAMEMLFSKAKQAATVAEGATEMAVEGAKATAKTATAAAEGAASTAAATTSSGLVAQGAAVAAAWAPAAAAVSAATFGANAIPASIGILAVGAATVAAMALASAGALAISSVASAGARAQGGKVEKDKQYLVGELGREMFVPDQNGFILSHSKLKEMEQAEPRNNVYDITKARGFGGNSEPSVVPQAFTGTEASYTNITVESPYTKTEPKSSQPSEVSPFKEDDSEGASRDPIQVVNIVDPNLMRDYLDTEDGERLIVNIMRRNKA